MERVLVLALTLSCAAGAVTSEVFKLIQYQSDGLPLGSHVSALNFLGAHYLNKVEIPRKVTLVALSELTRDVWEEILSYKPSGVLIILDHSAFSQGMEELLGTELYNFPVYFTEHSEEIIEIYHQLLHIATGTSDDQFQFSVSTDEKYPLIGLEQVNYYGFISEYIESLPTIALVTHYDAFSIVPDLTVGAHNNGSGVVAFLELARILTSLFEKGLPGYNVLLLATSAGVFNFQGLRAWLDSESSEIQGIAANIVFALCLDSLGQGEALHMHISRFHKESEADVIKFYTAVNETTQAAGTELVYTKKKVNMASQYTPWQHENFSKKKVVSATVSNAKGPSSSLIERGHLFDTKETVSVEDLDSNIRCLSEVFFKFLYGLDPKLKLLNKPELTSKEQLQGLIENVTQHIRFPTKLAKAAEFNSFFKESLENLTHQPFTVHTFNLENYVLYPSRPETLHIYRVKPAILDFYIFFGVLTYIGVLWGVLKLCGEIDLRKRKTS